MSHSYHTRDRTGSSSQEDCVFDVTLPFVLGVRLLLILSCNERAILNPLFHVT
jgi:hypothetical protein